VSYPRPWVPVLHVSLLVSPPPLPPPTSRALPAYSGSAFWPRSAQDWTRSPPPFTPFFIIDKAHPFWRREPWMPSAFFHGDRAVRSVQYVQLPLLSLFSFQFVLPPYKIHGFKLVVDFRCRVLASAGPPSLFLPLYFFCIFLAGHLFCSSSPEPPFFVLSPAGPLTPPRRTSRPLHKIFHPEMHLSSFSWRVKTCSTPFSPPNPFCTAPFSSLRPPGVLCWQFPSTWCVPLSSP